MTAANAKHADNTPTLVEIESLLYREADCLDRADLDEWLSLYTDDAVYWLPATEDQPDPFNHISIIYDNRTLMEIRRHYFKHPLAPSHENKVRCSHVITNICVEGWSAETGNCTVRSNFQAVVYQKTQTLFAGKYVHELVPAGDSYLIRSKRVDLINCEAPHRSIVIYI